MYCARVNKQLTHASIMCVICCCCCCKIHENHIQSLKCHRSLHHMHMHTDMPGAWLIVVHSICTETRCESIEHLHTLPACSASNQLVRISINFNLSLFSIFGANSVHFFQNCLLQPKLALIETLQYFQQKISKKCSIGEGTERVPLAMQHREVVIAAACHPHQSPRSSVGSLQKSNMTREGKSCLTGFLLLQLVHACPHPQQTCCKTAMQDANCRLQCSHCKLKMLQMNNLYLQIIFSCRLIIYDIYYYCR